MGALAMSSMTLWRAQAQIAKIETFKLGDKSVLKLSAVSRADLIRTNAKLLLKVNTLASAPLPLGNRAFHEEEHPRSCWRLGLYRRGPQGCISPRLDLAIVRSEGLRSSLAQSLVAGAKFQTAGVELVRRFKPIDGWHRSRRVPSSAGTVVAA
jgi:hypothetical protein